MQNKLKRMIQAINRVEDIKQFARDLMNEDLIFHPDDDFNSYIDVKNNPIYTPQEAEIRNKLMNDCFALCNKLGIDIYSLMLEVINGCKNKFVL